MPGTLVLGDDLMDGNTQFATAEPPGSDPVDVGPGVQFVDSGNGLISPNGEWAIVPYSSDGLPALENLQTGAVTDLPQDANHDIQYSGPFSPDSTKILGFDATGQGLVYDVPTGQTTSEPGFESKLHGGPQSGVALCTPGVMTWFDDTTVGCGGPDPSNIYAGSDEFEVYAIPLGGSASLIESDPSCNPWATLTNTYWEISCYDSTTQTNSWELINSSGTSVYSGSLPSGTSMDAVALSSDGSQIAMVESTSSGSLQLSILGASPATYTLPTGYFGDAVAWSPDDSTLAVAVQTSSGIQVLYLDPASGAVEDTTTLSSQVDRVWALAWNDNSCADVTDESDGLWDFGGCFSEPDSTTYDDSGDQPVSLDGLTLDGTGGGAIDLSDGGSTGDDVTDTGPVDVSADLSSLGAVASSSAAAGSRPQATATSAGTGVLLAQLSQLDWSLSSGSLQLPAVSPLQVAGLPLSGTLKVTPKAGGIAIVSGQATLPGVLGGGRAAMTLTTAYGKGVTALKVTAKRANLAGLLPLKGVKLAFSSSKWSVSATAVPPGSTGSPVSGSLSYGSNGQLTAGSLQTTSVPLAGLVTLSQFQLSYSASTGWVGSATIAQGSSTAAVKLSFNSSGQLTSGYLHASNVQLFSVLGLKTFNFDVSAPNTWKLTVVPSAKGGTKASATLSMANGAVTGASFDLEHVSMLRKLTLDSLELHYSLSNGNSDYGGKLAVTMPGPAGSEISGKSEMSFENGRFVSGSIDVDGLTVPLGWGAVLHRLGASVSVNPFVLGGDAGISLGPKLPAIGRALDLEGSLKYSFGTSTYDGSGSVSVGDVELGHGTFQVKASAATASMTITLGKGDGSDGLHLGKLAYLHGTMSGSFDGSSLSFSGSASFDIAGHEIGRGSLAANERGIAACSSSGNGFTWNWGASPVPHFDGSCSLSGY